MTTWAGRRRNLPARVLSFGVARSTISGYREQVRDFLVRHQSKLLALATVLSAAALIWLDEHRQHGGLPTGQAAPGLSVRLLGKQDAPGFDAKLLGSDRRITLAALHGQPAVLDFWATWCAPCRASLPHLDALAKRYTGKVRFIAVNAEGEDEALVSEARDKLKLEMPVAVGGREAADLYHVEVLPTTVVLDGNGRIADTFTGSASPETIARSLDKLL
jgi:thiol-disulfide isomerase/thioredoxin